MKQNFFTKFVLVILLTVLVFSCNKTRTTNDVAGTGAVAKAEKIMQEEMKLPAPDFKYPYIEITDMDVPDMPEKVTWITAEGKNLASKDAKVGGTWHESIAEYASTFRTVGPEANGWTRRLLLTNAGLLWYVAETQTYLPLSATHWAYGADKKTVYFKLRDDIRWSDGEKCTAQDWVFNQKFMVDPNLNDPWYNNWYKNMEVTALNDYLLRIKWVSKDVAVTEETLLDYCLFPPRPAHFYTLPLAKDWYVTYNWKPEPTTGPYVMNMDETTEGERMVFDRVDNWWARAYPYCAGIANPQKLEYKVISGGIDMLENYFFDGKLDFLTVYIPEKLRSAETKENVVKGYIDRYYNYVKPIQGLQGIVFNTDYYLFRDKNARKAMYYAIDIQGMIDKALYGEYARYHNIGIGQSYAGVQFNDDTIRKPAFDPQKAKELLAKAGYTTLGKDGILVNDKGDRASFELLYSATNHTERYSILVEQAKKAGVEMKLKLMESGSFNAARKKQYQAYAVHMSVNDIPSFWEYFHSDNTTKHSPESNNFWNYSNPEMDKLITAFDDAKTLKEKAVYSKKIERMVDDEALIIPQYYVPYDFSMLWKWVRVPAWGSDKVGANGDNWLDPWHGYVWIDEDIRKEVLSAMDEGKTFETRYYHLTDRYKPED